MTTDRLVFQREVDTLVSELATINLTGDRDRLALIDSGKFELLDRADAAVYKVTEAITQALLSRDDTIAAAGVRAAATALERAKRAVAAVQAALPRERD